MALLEFQSEKDDVGYERRSVRRKKCSIELLQPVKKNYNPKTVRNFT